MTDSDDLLTLPVEGDDARGPADPAGRAGGAPRVRQEGQPSGRPAPLMPGGELVALSSEARLATALLLQAQALEGMRQAHSDLLRRLDDSGSGGARHAAEELHVALRELQQAQQQTLGQVTRARRRAEKRTVALAAVLVILALGVAWYVQSSRDEVSRSLAGLAGSTAAERAELEQSLKSTLEDAGGKQVALLEQLVANVQSNEAQLRDQLVRSGSELEAARAEVTRGAQASATLQTELATAKQAHESLQDDLQRTRDDRNRQIGEAGRLREQVADRDRQLAVLADTMSKLRADLDARAAAPAGRIVTTNADPESFAARVTAALHGSGASSASVVEVGPVRDGALTDVLVMFVDDAGAPGRILRAATASLLAEHGRSLLRLDGVVAQATGQPVAGEDIVLPSLDKAAWSGLGLQVPAGFVPIPQVAAALGALLAPHGYHVVHLDSFDGLTLGGLELRQEDGRGELLRTLKAARGEVLPVGPELALEGGTIRIGEDERPFFQGQCRVPLPGGDYGAWLASVASDGK